MLPRLARLRPLLLGASTALALGCEAAAPPPPPAAATIVVAAPVEADLPFRGTYPKQVVVSFRNGRRVNVLNAAGKGSLKVAPAKVTFEQDYEARGQKMHVVQVYAFSERDVEPLGDDAWGVKLAFVSIEGDTQNYSPDKGSPRLLVRRRPGGFEITLLTIDTSGVLAGVAFGAEPPEQPGADILAYAQRTGLTQGHSARGDIVAPPDVASPPSTAATTPSGLAHRVLEPGNGNVHPGPDDTVVVHYTGWTTDGQMFDSTLLRGEPARLKLAHTIKGWVEGVGLMVAGEKRRLWIPADQAYGRNTAGVSPEGDLVFDVELVEVIAAPKGPPAPSDVAAPPKDAKKTKSGLAYRVLKKGKGTRSPKGTDEVVVSYTGWTTDGRMFDSSTSRGPATLPLSAVIKGWAEGLQLMKVGDVARFWMPADLAYGTNPRPGTPAGMLVFDVELHEIK